MSTPAIEGVLSQMRALSRAQGAALPTAASPATAGAGFAGELQRSLERISQAQQQAYGQAEAFEMGAPGVSLNDVMVDLQKAQIGLQMGVQVRNRMVQAYQDVMNMQA